MKTDGRRKTNIEKKCLKKLYLLNKLTISKIAEKYKCSRNTICYWLKKYNIKQRTASESMKLFNNRKPINIPKERIFNLYNKGLSINQLAKEFNCSNSTILNRLRRYKITKKFSNWKKISFNKEELKELYLNKKLSTYEISDKFGCCQATIWKRLKEFKIKIRETKDRFKIPSKKELKKWYIKDKLSTWKIEKKYGYSRSLVHRKLKKYGIKIRNRAQSHIIFPRKDFSGNLIEKAYLIGFRMGDLRVRKFWKNSETIIVDCSSTVPAQIKLIKKLFKRYGKIWIKENLNRQESYIQTEARLNTSFSFLLENEAPNWLFKDKKYFFPFLAGFTDAEGTISIKKRDNQAYFSIVNQNKKVLEKIRNKLLSRGIIGTNLNIQSKKGTPRIKGNKIYYSNNDCWAFHVNRKNHLLNLLRNLEPYLKHEKKVNNLKLAKSNILERNRKFGA